MKPWPFALVGVALFSLTATLFAEDRLGPYGDGSHRRCSNSILPFQLQMIKAIVLDPQKRQNPGTAAPRGSRWGSTRNKNIVSRAGEIALLTPGTSGTDIGIYSQTGQLLRQFPTALSKSTRGEWGSSTEGRDLRPGEFSVYWASDDTLHFQSSGDNFHYGAFDAMTGAARTWAGTSSFNMHGYFGMCDGCPAVILSASGHGQGNTYFKFKVNGVAKNMSNTPHDFNNPTPLMDATTVYVTCPETIPSAALSGTTYTFGYGTKVRSLNYVPATGTYNTGWTWSIPNDANARGYDGMAASKPWCMDATRICLITHPAIYHFDLDQPSTLRVLSRATGAQTMSTSLGKIITGNLLSYQVSLSGDRLAVLSVRMTSNTSTHLQCVDLNGGAVSWQYDYNPTETTVDDQWHAETTRVYATDAEICVCWTATNATKKTVDVIVDRFSWNGGSPIRAKFSIPVPGVGTQAYVQDFVILDGYAYALITYREFVAGGTFTGGGQLLAIMGSP